MKKLASFILAIFVLVTIFACDKDDQEPQTSPSCTIDLIDVGKADCIVIKTASRVIMIDTGEQENLPSVIFYLSQNEITKIDTLILTHYDKDHIGGAYKIIQDYNVETIIESSFTSKDEEYTSYHELANSLGINLLKLTENHSFSFDGCDFDIDIPKKSKYKDKNSNNSSLIISLKCGDKRFLFCGDAMEARLDEFIATAPGKYDFVKMPYHGNYIENLDEFLDEVKPDTVAITCSKKNPASAEVLALLSERKIITYQTRFGTVSLSIKDNEIRYA